MCFFSASTSKYRTHVPTALVAAQMWLCKELYKTKQTFQSVTPLCGFIPISVPFKQRHTVASNFVVEYPLNQQYVT